MKIDQVAGQVSLTPPNAGRNQTSEDKTFTFDTVFGQESKQVDIYNETARPIVDYVLEGYNGA